MVQTVGGGLLVSPLWYKPGVRLPPRVANMVQTPGETLAGKWWMCQYPYGKNTGVRTMVQTGGKVTCTSWELNPWCEVQPRVATPWCEVQTLGSTPWCEVQPLVSQLDDAAARVHVVVLLGGECMRKPRYNHWVKTNPSCNCTLPPTGCIVLGCMRVVRATS